MGLGSGGITLRCGVGCRRSLDLMVLVTVAYTPAVVGLIRPLAREPPYDVGGGGGGGRLQPKPKEERQSECCVELLET